jgi:hypothetical protein
MLESSFCNYMLSSSIPLLQGEELCQFLKNLDENEARLLREEKEKIQQQLVKLEREYSWSNIIIGGDNSEIAQATAAIAFSMFGFLGGMGSDMRKDVIQFHSILELSVLFGGTCKKITNACAIYNERKNSLNSGLIFVNEHILRLVAKIRKIKKRLKDEIDDNEREQLCCTNDFFTQQIECLNSTKTQNQMIGVVNV